MTNVNRKTVTESVNYTITLNSNQMHEVNRAIELLMRLKLGQYQELVYNLCDIRNPKLSARVSDVDTMLKQAFTLMNQEKQPSEYKDEQWRILYDLYQVLRKAIHDAEHPDGTGIDAQEPIKISHEPLAKCTWRQ